MGAYTFNSNNHFLRFSDKTNNLHVYELHNSDSLPLSPHDWKLVVSIGPNEKLDSLKVFDSVIDGIRLKNLEEDLCNSHLMINPEGFCYLDTTEIVGPTFNVQYYKLNDLFCWSEYVDLPSNMSFKTSWKRCGIQTGDTLVDYDQNNEDLNKKSTLFKRMEDELTSTRKQLAAAEQALKQKQEELREADNKIFQYETRLENKEEKLRRLREKLASTETELEEVQSKIRTQNEGTKKVTSNEAEPSSSTTNVSSNMQQTLLEEWQNLTVVWNSNRELVDASKFVQDNPSFSFASVFGVILVRPQFDGPLREFTPMDDYTCPQGEFLYNVKMQLFDKGNWWCIGSHEHNKKIDLTVYDGTYDCIEAYGTRVYVPYRQKYFFSSSQCFVGFLRGVGFRFMYVSAQNKE